MVSCLIHSTLSAQSRFLVDVERGGGQHHLSRSWKDWPNNGLQWSGELRRPGLFLRNMHTRMGHDRRQCEESIGWLFAWGWCECMLIRSSTVWILPSTLSNYTSPRCVIWCYMSHGLSFRWCLVLGLCGLLVGPIGLIVGVSCFLCVPRRCQAFGAFSV